LSQLSSKEIDMRFYGLILLLLLLPVLSARCETITPAMRKEDPRLAKKVSLDASRMQMGEIMRKLAEQTGVSIQAAEKDGAADVPLFVRLHDVPLGEALDSLWSVVSYDKAEYSWTRSGEPGAYQYTLTQPLKARTLRIRLHEKLIQDYEREAADAEGFLRMSPKEQKAAAAGNPLLKTILDYPRHRNGMSIFFDSIPADVRSKILSGETEYYKLPVSEMTESGKALIHDTWFDQTANSRVPGAKGGTPEPTYVVFASRPDGSGRVAPSLGIQIERMGGVGYIGGKTLEDEINRRHAKMWMLPEDSRESPLLDKTVGPSSEKPFFTGNVNVSALLKQRLSELSYGAPLSLIARLPRVSGASNDAGPPSNRVVKEFLSVVEDGPIPIQTKWRGSILLLTHPGWFETEANVVPFSMVMHLRKSLEAHGGLLPLSELYAAADKLSFLQLRDLRYEFPVMDGVSLWQPVLAPLNRSAQLAARLQDKAGLPLTNDTLAVLKSMKYDQFGGKLNDETAAAFRMIVKEKEGAREVSFYLYDRESRFMAGVGFMQTVNPKKPPEE
jgi:hypothetical protein